jgi:UTP-glucose-1-phosphate uridylyltransferase
MAAMLASSPYFGMRYEGQRFDCGDRLGFLKANLAFGLDRADLAPGLRDFIKEIRL